MNTDHIDIPPSGWGVAGDAADFLGLPPFPVTLTRPQAAQLISALHRFVAEIGKGIGDRGRKPEEMGELAHAAEDISRAVDLIRFLQEQAPTFLNWDGTWKLAEPMAVGAEPCIR